MSKHQLERLANKVSRIRFELWHDVGRTQGSHTSNELRAACEALERAMYHMTREQP
jgi:hypothetical protein